MIKFEYTEVFNFAGAFRGMRNPMDSWDLSDSYTENGEFHIGEKDMDLAQRLIKAGSDHRKFLRQIFVCTDITCCRSWFLEFDTYKVGTTSNSCSTMHRIHARKITLDDFSHEELSKLSLAIFKLTISVLNHYRKKFIETKNKKYWWQLIRLLPQSYIQKRTVTMTYENLRNMYHARNGHKMDEWRVGFVEWIDTLPYADELIKC